MKTPNEWFDEIVNALRNPKGSVASIITQIQLDAWRQGMTDAAEIAHPTVERYQNRVEMWLGVHDMNTATDIEKRILAARDAKGQP